ncbi:hypothetical protein SFR_3418 [Streptomyces sp. FR-008]|nr:hypothetical protein SFR_3418 [Streptomyces sp. FR-008]
MMAFPSIGDFSTRTKGDGMRLLGREDVGVAAGRRGCPGTPSTCV